MVKRNSRKVAYLVAVKHLDLVCHYKGSIDLVLNSGPALSVIVLGESRSRKVEVDQAIC